MKLDASFIRVGSVLAIIACSGSSTSPSSTQAVSASSGATLFAGSATLAIPPGALTRDTIVTLRETEPHQAGRTVRVEVEPHDALGPDHHALVSVRMSESNVTVRMHDGGTDSLMDVEMEDRDHHAFKTSMTKLGDVEVESHDGAPCATPCASGQECHDGTCEVHHMGALCSAVCPLGEECDDGACATHDQCAMDHHGEPGTCSTCGDH